MAEEKPPNTGGTTEKSSGGSSLNKKTLGLPMWAWVPIIAGVAGFAFLYLRNKKANAAAASASTTPPTATTDTSGLATDQAEYIYATLRDLQQAESSEPTPAPGPPGPPGPPGTPGTPGPPAPAPAPTPAPLPRHLTVTADGKTSLSTYATRYHTSVAYLVSRIYASQPEDASRNSSSPLYKYMHAANWDKPVPAGTPVEITT